MIKKLIMAFVAIIIASSANAQIKFGIETGINASKLLVSSPSKAEQNGGMKFGFQIGGTIDYNLGNSFILMSGLSFQQTRTEAKLLDHEVVFFPKTEIKLNNLFVPVKIGYNIKINDKLSIIPSFGLYVNYAFDAGKSKIDIIETSGETNYKTTSTTWKPTDGLTYKVSDEPITHYASLQAFRNWTVGGIGGIKMILCDHYTLSLNYSCGINYMQSQNSLKNSSFQAAIGYRF